MEGAGKRKQQQQDDHDHDHDHDHDDDRRQQQEVLDGSDIMELVENHTVFSKYVDGKFKELDQDKDGELSVNELRPAVVSIGAALGLPAHGTSSNSDLIYSQVLNEFTHGKEDKVSKTAFKEVLSDILIGMAAGLKRDPIVILRIDGEHLQEFISSPGYEAHVLSLLSQEQTLYHHILKAIQKLGVDQGLPPTSDPWVMSNILEPALESSIGEKKNQQGVSQETFLVELRKVLENIAERLKEKPVIVAHTENAYDGSAIKNLLSNKFETDKVLNSTLQTIPRDKHGRVSKDYLRVALDSLAPNAGLPPLGAVDEMDKIINEVFKMVGADDCKIVKEEEFKKLLLEILGSIMLQLQGTSISVSSNSVVDEPLADPSSFLNAPTSS